MSNQLERDLVSEIAKDVCGYLENTPQYETVAAYFFDFLMSLEGPLPKYERYDSVTFVQAFMPRLVVNNERSA